MFSTELGFTQRHDGEYRASNRMTLPSSRESLKVCLWEWKGSDRCGSLWELGWLRPGI